MIDISAKVENEKYYKALFTALIKHVDMFVFLLEKDGSIRFCTPNIASLLGYTVNGMKKKNFFDVIVSDKPVSVKATFAKCVSENKKKFEIPLTISSQEGVLKMQAMFSNLLAEPALTAILLTLRDITIQRNAQERIKFYKTFDALTKLPNRESFLRYAEVMISMSMPINKLFCVMALGLDHFKRINDIHGVEVGDKLLLSVAEALSRGLSHYASVFRYMGDQFFILFPDVSLQDTKSPISIKNLLSKVKSILDTPFVIDSTLELVVSASIGVAVFPSDGKNANELVGNAEAALYMAKDAGRSMHKLFDSNLSRELQAIQRLETDMLLAVSKRMFEPYFQVKVDRRGHVIGAEALARWKQNDGKVLSPEYFIDLAEKSGIIDKIGLMIMLKTCHFLSNCNTEKIASLPISLNLSPRQFSHEFLIEDISAVIELYGLEPQRFEFEITESSIMQNEKNTIDKLCKLKQLGVSISIDDFGTGYSSFSKLKDYPVDIVKLDKSFVKPLPDDSKTALVVAGIVDLAHKLGFSVVAEGVETIEQFIFLDNISCDQFQGFLFSEPVQELEFQAMMSGEAKFQVSVM